MNADKDQDVISQVAKNDLLYKNVNMMTGDINEGMAKIKGTGPNRGLLLQLMGPRHSQTSNIGKKFKHFVVISHIIKLCY